MRKVINFHQPYETGKELSHIKNVFKNKNFQGVGEYTTKCEKLISNKIKNKNVLLTDSCTSALDMVALLIKDHIKDEIIIPSYTFTSTASAFLKAGFKIVFAEIDPLTAMIDIQDVKNKLTKNTRAVVTVHYGGLVSKIKELKYICYKKNILLVEDAAQAFDCYLDNKAIGTFGDFGCYSFHETKNLHAGLSGALVIKNKKYFNRASSIRERGTNRRDVISGLKKKYSWVDIGGSYYPTELQSAFLFSQLEYSSKNKNYRKKIFNVYKKNLKKLKESGKIHFNLFETNYKFNYHAFYIMVKIEKSSEGLRKFLLNRNINAFIGYVPLHSSKMGRKLGYTSKSLPKTESVAKTVLRLPIHNKLTINEANYVCDEIYNYFN